MNSDLFDTYTLELELIEPILGTIPVDRDVYEAHVADVANRQDDERPPRTPEEVETRGWTSFYTDDEGQPVLMDYQVKGALKENANTLKVPLGVKNLRAHVGRDVFVYPRRTVLAEKVDGHLERPLRAMTPMGPRVTVVRSDYIDAGRSYTFEIRVVKDSKVTEKVLSGISEMFEMNGLGQWRGGSYGRCRATLTAT